MSTFLFALHFFHVAESDYGNYSFLFGLKICAYKDRQRGKKVEAQGMSTGAGRGTTPA